MIQFKLTYWQVLLIILSLLAAVLLTGVRIGKMNERLAQATAASEQAQIQYTNLSIQRAAERKADSLRLVSITSQNETIEQNIEAIIEAHEKNRKAIFTLGADSLLLRWTAMRARLDSIVTGQRWRND